MDIAWGNKKLYNLDFFKPHLDADSTVDADSLISIPLISIQDADSVDCCNAEIVNFHFWYHTTIPCSIHAPASV